MHPHEAPPVMTSPMVILAIGSLCAGGFLMLVEPADRLPAAGGRHAAAVARRSSPPVAIIALALVVVGGGAGAGRCTGGARCRSPRPRGSFVTVAARKDLYGDAINESVLMRPGQWLTRLSVYFDNRGVDGLVNTVAATMGGTSGRMRRVQTGFVRSYALSMLVGAVLLVGALLLVDGPRELR